MPAIVVAEVVAVSVAAISDVADGVAAAIEVGLATAAVVGVVTAAVVAVLATVGAVVGVTVAGGTQLTIRDKLSKSTAATNSRFLVISNLLYSPLSKLTRLGSSGVWPGAAAGARERLPHVPTTCATPGRPPAHGAVVGAAGDAGDGAPTAPAAVCVACSDRAAAVTVALAPSWIAVDVATAACWVCVGATEGLATGETAGLGVATGAQLRTMAMSTRTTTTTMKGALAILRLLLAEYLGRLRQGCCASSHGRPAAPGASGRSIRQHALAIIVPRARAMRGRRTVLSGEASARGAPAWAAPFGPLTPAAHP